MRRLEYYTRDISEETLSSRNKNIEFIDNSAKRAQSRNRFRIEQNEISSEKLSIRRTFKLASQVSIDRSNYLFAGHFYDKSHGMLLVNAVRHRHNSDLEDCVMLLNQSFHFRGRYVDSSVVDEFRHSVDEEDFSVVVVVTEVTGM